MQDKNGISLVGVISFMGECRPESNPQKVVTQYGTGFVWIVGPQSVEIHLDGGGVYIVEDSQYVEVTT
jgi:hypothetical protein